MLHQEEWEMNRFLSVFVRFLFFFFLVLPLLTCSPLTMIRILSMLNCIIPATVD